MLGMEQMYKMALDPRIFPDARLLAVLQGKDSSLPMAVAMSAKQQRDKLEQAKAGQQAQMGAKQPTVRDTMLAKDLPQPQAGLDQLPAPTMETMGAPGMAAGGIVAFGMGGFTDPDEDDDTTEQDELDSLMARQGDLGGLGAGIMSVANPAAAQYSSFTKPGISPASAPGNFKDIAAEATKRHGASWDLVQHVMGKETGGMKDPAHAVSSKGAMGVMQLMPATAKQLGVTDPTDPNQNIDAGVKYLAQLEHKYKNPKLAAMAYNWGPGNVDKWMKHGSKESAVPKETRMYVASLAEGGAVGFKNKGSVSDYDTSSAADDASFGPTGMQDDDVASTLGLPTLDGGSLFKRRKLVSPIVPGVNPLQSALGIPQLGSSTPAAQPPVAKSPVQAAPQGPVSATQAQQDQGNMGPTRNELTSSFPTQPDAGQDMITKYLAGLEQSRKQAPGLALMAAGLGIAGQRSPYGLSNIGAGGLQGLQSYEQAQKQDQSGQMAALSAQAALDRNKIYAQHYGVASQTLGQNQLMAEFDKAVQSQLASIDKDATKKMWPQEKKTAEAQRLAALQIKSNPVAMQRYKQFGIDPNSLYTTTSALSDTAPTGGKEYK